MGVQLWRSEKNYGWNILLKVGMGVCREGRLGKLQPYEQCAISLQTGLAINWVHQGQIHGLDIGFAPQKYKISSQNTAVAHIKLMLLHENCQIGILSFICTAQRSSCFKVQSVW